MTTKEKIISIRLAEKIEHNPKYAKALGISISTKGIFKDLKKENAE